MKQRPLWAAILCAVVGILILTFSFGRVWPATNWTVLSRSTLIERGRDVAAQFGFSVAGWQAYAVPQVATFLTRYTPAPSPLTLRINYHAPGVGKPTEVGFDSAGRLTYFKAPEDGHSAKHFTSNGEAAQAAFQIAAGSQASAYQPPTDFAGDERNEREFTFRKTQAPNKSTAPGSDIRENIKVVVRDSAVKQVERNTTLTDGDPDDAVFTGVWNVIPLFYGLIYTAGTITVIALFVLWAVRRALSYRFPIRVAIGSVILMCLLLFANYGWDKLGTNNNNGSGSDSDQIFLLIGAFLFVAVGRSISPGDRGKWMSLEQLCWLSPIAKPTATAIGAGLLFSPLLASLPFLIAACGFFPDTHVLPRNVEILYSRFALADSMEIQLCVSLLFFFGFCVPALHRFVQLRGLRFLIVVSAGIFFFSDWVRVVAGSAAVPLIAGLLTFALFWFVWSHFDLLAVLICQIAASLLLSLAIVLQKQHNGWAIVAVLLGLAISTVWIYLRGDEIAQGDPSATNPILTGFRAEREKLLAEFSIARRAQQDMLPPAPPDIPGFSLAASCTPSLEVGGDLYDFLKLPDGRVGIGVADVSGKGVPAALYMTLTKGLLAAVSTSSSEIASVVEEVNLHLHSVTRKKVFVTMALGFLDVKSRILECVRAGHNPVVWRRKQANLTSLVTPGGIGLGITASKIFRNQLKVENMQLTDGDAVVFYSDGITEAMNGDLEQFGEGRLMAAVEKTDGMDAASARNSILGEVKEFLNGVHPQDDMTIVVLRVGQ